MGTQTLCSIHLVCRGPRKAKSLSDIKLAHCGPPSFLPLPASVGYSGRRTVAYFFRRIS